MDLNTAKWTLLEMLTQVATAKIGDPMPECLRVPTVWHGPKIPIEAGGHIGVASNNWADPLSALAQEAHNEIVRLTLAYDTALDYLAEYGRRVDRMPNTRPWQPLDTAPVPSATEINPRVYRFRCMLQDKKGWVFEGNAHYVQFSRATNPEWVLRWYNARGQLQNPPPLYWMPMPAPKQEK